jgi:hypothetical protein
MISKNNKNILSQQTQASQSVSKMERYNDAKRGISF